MNQPYAPNLTSKTAYERYLNDTRPMVSRSGGNNQAIKVPYGTWLRSNNKAQFDAEYERWKSQR